MTNQVHPYSALTPDRVIDAVESTDRLSDAPAGLSLISDEPGDDETVDEEAPEPEAAEADATEPDATDSGEAGSGALTGSHELEDIIRRVIRVELAGEMGQRLSQNIKRMIKDEVERMNSPFN